MKTWICLVLFSLSVGAAADRKVQFKVYPPNARVSLIVGAQQSNWPLEASGLVPDRFFAEGRRDLEFVLEDPKKQHHSVTVQVHKNAIQPGQTYQHPTPISLKPIGLAVLTDWVVYPTWASYGLLVTAALGLLAISSRRSLSKVERDARQTAKEIREVEQATGVSLPPGKTHFDRIGNYYVVRALGQGGFGTVSLGCQVNQRNAKGLVAIKRPILPALNPQDPAVKELRGEQQRAQYLAELQREVEQRFMRECKRHQELDHPNIVKLVDYNKDAEGIYLVMEYLPGTTFQAFLVDRGPLSVPESLVYLEQICEGLHAVHLRGVTHRDVKPDNMILSDGRIKITDFGTARKKTLDSAYMTIAGDDGPRITGTILYMAPEAIRILMAQSSELDLLSSPAIDQYAVGVTLYQMLTGTYPVTGNDVYFPDLPSIPVSHHRTDLPPALVDCIDRMLSKEPQDRYPDLRQAFEAVRSAAHG